MSTDTIKLGILLDFVQGIAAEDEDGRCSECDEPWRGDSWSSCCIGHQAATTLARFEGEEDKREFPLDLHPNARAVLDAVEVWEDNHRLDTHAVNMMNEACQKWKEARFPRSVLGGPHPTDVGPLLKAFEDMDEAWMDGERDSIDQARADFHKALDRMGIPAWVAKAGMAGANDTLAELDQEERTHTLLKQALAYIKFAHWPDRRSACSACVNSRHPDVSCATAPLIVKLEALEKELSDALLGENTAGESDE